MISLNARPAFHIALPAFSTYLKFLSDFAQTWRLAQQADMIFEQEGVDGLEKIQKLWIEKA